MTVELKKRVQILDGMHAQVGAKMIEWTLKPATRPTNVTDLRTQLSGLATIAPEVTSVQFIDTPPDVALFRLPPADMVQKSLDRALDPSFNISDYKLPGYYKVVDPAKLGVDALTLFRSRVGDYTTGECQ